MFDFTIYGLNKKFAAFTFLKFASWLNYFCCMKITDEMINHLAHLSRLEFSDEEKIELKKDLEKMIEFVEKLKEVDTTGVEPLMHITDAVNILREDDSRKNYYKTGGFIKRTAN